MEPLWGDFLPVPEGKINPIKGDVQIQIGGKNIKALDTPGHANHHISYLVNGICFSGDVGGVRIKGIPFLRLPTVPPEFDPIKWRNSIKRFRKEDILAFAPTHFDIQSDSEWHLNAIESALEEVEAWMEQVMPLGLTHDEVRRKYNAWMENQSESAGLNPEDIQRYNLAISSQMSADGIYRYWNKKRQP
jgi:glyoxylase-like metal-dependent hydrolase (beta-lactamase superfamily II)